MISLSLQTEAKAGVGVTGVATTLLFGKSYLAPSSELARPPFLSVE